MASRTTRKKTPARGAQPLRRKPQARAAAAPARKKRAAAPGGGDRWRARVRMYRHGLGDCFLLTFRGGGRTSHVLVDCGTLGTSSEDAATIDEVLADVRAVTGGALDAVVATHEHKDHVSGFREEAFTKGLSFEEAWVAWTEDPVRGGPLAKRKGDLLGASLEAARALRLAAKDGGGPELALLATGIEAVSEFHGAAPFAFGAAKKLAETVNEAMNAVCRGARQQPPRYLSPGQVLAPGFAPGVKVYVLGPPTDAAKLKRLGSHGAKELYEVARAVSLDVAAAALGLAATMDRSASEEERKAAADEAERRLPFDRSAGLPLPSDELPASYREEAWRRVDHDWLHSAANLAIQLDNETNNTSLVLAFELDGGDVLLFAADAQLGNWESWKDVVFEGSAVTAGDLLGRTVLYKVGHHASHNATMRAGGLEAMSSPSLVAFIPVDQVKARGMGKKDEEGIGWRMPADGLYRRLLQKTKGWVVRSDTGWPDQARPGARPGLAVTEHPGDGKVLAYDFTLG